MADKNESLYDNNLRGALFQNKRREEEVNPEKKAKLPHYQGSCEIDGVEYWIGGWKKQSKDKKTVFVSLSFTPKEEQKKTTNGDLTDLPF